MSFFFFFSFFFLHSFDLSLASLIACNDWGFWGPRKAFFIFLIHPFARSLSLHTRSVSRPSRSLLGNPVPISGIPTKPGFLPGEAAADGGGGGQHREEQLQEHGQGGEAPGRALLGLSRPRGGPQTASLQVHVRRGLESQDSSTWWGIASDEEVS